VQGSSLGPAAYVVAVADLRPRRDDNVIIKYADDAYLIVPSDNNDTCTDELRHIQAWADSNNLCLNAAQSREIVFQTHNARRKMIQLSPPCLNIEQVDRITMLGVVVNNRMTAADHVAQLLRSCTKLLYTLRVLRSHGLPQQSLKDVFRATVESIPRYSMWHQRGPDSAQRETVSN